MPLESPNTRFDGIACEVCGHPVPPHSGAGRPRVRHGYCDQLGKTLNWLETAIDNTRLYLDERGKEKVRRRLEFITESLNVDDYVGDSVVRVLNENDNGDRS